MPGLRQGTIVGEVGDGGHETSRYTPAHMSIHVRATRTDRSSRETSVPRVAAPLASLRALDAAAKRIEADLQERFPDAT